MEIFVKGKFVSLIICKSPFINMDQLVIAVHVFISSLACCLTKHKKISYSVYLVCFAISVIIADQHQQVCMVLLVINFNQVVVFFSIGKDHVNIHVYHAC